MYRDIYHVNGRPYLMLRELGTGGSSRVVSVLTAEGEVRALKIVDISQAQPATLELFQNEVALLRKLQGCAGVVQLFDAEIVAGQRLLLVIEQGETDLRAMLPRLDDAVAIRWRFLQMVNAVAAVHQRGVVHGDLKPGNFLLVRGVMKLIDFGIAKQVRHADTTNITRLTAVGTVNFMPPESFVFHPTEARYKFGQAGDVWSLGVILYLLVYRRLPFDAQDDILAKVNAIQKAEVDFAEPAIGGTEGLITVIGRCLQKDKALRPTCEALQRDPLVLGREADPDVDPAECAHLYQFITMVQTEWERNADWSAPPLDDVRKQAAACLRAGRRVVVRCQGRTVDVGDCDFWEDVGPGF